MHKTLHQEILIKNHDQAPPPAPLDIIRFIELFAGERDQEAESWDENKRRFVKYNEEIEERREFLTRGLWSEKVRLLEALGYKSLDELEGAYGRFVLKVYERVRIFNVGRRVARAPSAPRATTRHNSSGSARASGREAKGKEKEGEIEQVKFSRQLAEKLWDEVVECLYEKWLPEPLIEWSIEKRLRRKQDLITQKNYFFFALNFWEEMKDDYPEIDIGPPKAAVLFNQFPLGEPSQTRGFENAFDRLQIQDGPNFSTGNGNGTGIGNVAGQSHEMIDHHGGNNDLVTIQGRIPAVDQATRPDFGGRDWAETFETHGNPEWEARRARRTAELEAHRIAGWQADKAAKWATAYRAAEWNECRAMELEACRAMVLATNRVAELQARRIAGLEAHRVWEAQRAADMEAHRVAELEAHRIAERQTQNGVTRADFNSEACDRNAKTLESTKPGGDGSAEGSGAKQLKKS